MRAGFLITSLGHGIGGHFHDVRSLYISWLNSKTIQTDLICLKSVFNLVKACMDCNRTQNALILLSAIQIHHLLVYTHFVTTKCSHFSNLFTAF